MKTLRIILIATLVGGSLGTSIALNLQTHLNVFDGVSMMTNGFLVGSATALFIGTAIFRTQQQRKTWIKN